MERIKVKANTFSSASHGNVFGEVGEKDSTNQCHVKHRTQTWSHLKMINKRGLI